MTLNKDNIPKVYYSITAITTLATALIWGINTLFLLKAGLSNVEAFSANAVYSFAQVVFEVPTGLVADTKGRARSFIYGSLTLTLGTFLYVVLYENNASFLYWAIASAILGLGFTFYSGATEAWLVDAMKHFDRENELQKVLATNQIVTGSVMLTGATIGGVLAQYAGFTTAYVLRSVLLVFSAAIAFTFMKDFGFEPHNREKWFKYTNETMRVSLLTVKTNKNILYMMIGGAISFGTFGYAFYALQPYILGLSGDKTNFILAGASASLMAMAQILGGLLNRKFSHKFQNRKVIIISGVGITAFSLIAVGLVESVFPILLLFFMMAITFAFVMPTRQVALNEFLPSNQRATLLSIDSLGGSLAGAAANPPLGKIADVHGYGPSYVVSGLSQLLAIPILARLKLKHSKEVDEIS